MPVSFREVQYKQDKRFGEKIDRTKTIKAVIVDELGNDSGSGEIWADRLSRRVWVRELGTAGSSQVPCYNITPVIGLGVILGYETGSNVREVLRTDKDFFGPTNPNGTSYESPSNTDFLPGGRLQLWLASKLIQPLSTFPATSGLFVNVVAGDYPYAGTRKTFAGQTNVALTQNPNVGQHYYAGLYLDSANALQVVYGASIAVASTPPEPAWPAGAFRLSVVRVNNTQTSITMALDTDTTNDILDRRMAWSDEKGAGGWPNAGLAMINSTEYDTIPLAITAATTGDIIKVGQGTDSGGITVDESVAIVGLSPRETILTHNDTTTVTVTAANVTLEDLTVENTDATGTVPVVLISADGATLDNCIVNKTSGANSTSIGVSIGAGNTVGTLIRDCKIRVSQGSVLKWGVYLHTAATYTVIEGGEINGDTRDIYVDHASAVVELRGVKLLGGGIEINAGTVRGWYIDAAGQVVNAGDADAQSANDIYSGGSLSDSDFTSTIATLPGGAVLTYGAITTGAEANLVPLATTQLAKMVLHNTTRGTNALISNCVVGTNTITLTANVPAGWVVGDTITIRSTTNTTNPAGGAWFVDFEITSGIVASTNKAWIFFQITDTGGAAFIMTHPYEANVNSKRLSIRYPAAIAGSAFTGMLPVFVSSDNRYCMAWDVSGAATFTLQSRLVLEGAYL